MLFFGVNISAMPYEFRDDPPEPQTDSSSGRGALPPVKSIGVDFLDFGEPAKPPAGLMRKRPHVAVWILAALVLGGLIAFVLVGLSSG